MIMADNTMARSRFFCSIFRVILTLFLYGTSDELVTKDCCEFEFPEGFAEGFDGEVYPSVCSSATAFSEFLWSGEFELFCGTGS